MLLCYYNIVIRDSWTLMVKCKPPHGRRGIGYYYPLTMVQ